MKRSAPRMVTVDGSLTTSATGEVKKVKSRSFAAMGLSPAVLKGIARLNYTKPTPIQRKAIPLALQGHDLVAMARTGSGKTAAFVLPILEKLKEHSEIVGARALILSPTRDLALQTIKFVRQMGKETDLRSILVTGGESMHNQFTDLSLNPDIIVATPGRLLHHIVEVGITFSRLEVLVYDEADRMFEMGFADQISAIAKTLRTERQTMLFSATLPTMVFEFARAGLTDPKLVRLDKHVTLPPNLDLCFFVTSTEQKIAAFMYLFKFVIRSEQQTIVFCATRHSCQLLAAVLDKLLIIKCGIVFGSMEPEMRKLNVERFRHSRMQVLLVTDVAARGIDIPALDVVVNYDMPATPKIFVHRVGRVGRGDAQSDPNRKFVAYSLVSTMDQAHMCDVHLFLGKPLSTTLAEDGKPSCTYGAIPATMLDDEYNQFKRALRDVELSEKNRIAVNANENYFKTRSMATKEGAALSKTIEHFPIHPLILALGDVAGGDPREEKRLELVRSYLGGFRPRQTVLELEHSSTRDSLAVMEAKRAKHPERRERKRRAAESVDAAVEGPAEVGILHSDGGDGGDSDDSDDSDSASKASSSLPVPAVRAGKFSGAFKDPDFFMSMHQGDSSVRTQSDGLRIRGGISGERDVILDLMPDDEKAIKTNGLVWDRRKKKYIGANEADKRSSSVKSTTSTRQLVNEAGRRLTKADEKIRGKVYKEWQEKTKKSIPMVGEREGAETSSAFQERARTSRGRSKWGEPKQKRVRVDDSGGELRAPEQVRKVIREKERNKIKQMSKKDRAAYVARKREAGKGKGRAGGRGQKKGKGGGGGGRGGRR